jgi:hypothetical protein
VQRCFKRFSIQFPISNVKFKSLSISNGVNASNSININLKNKLVYPPNGFIPIQGFAMIGIIQYYNYRA